MTTLRRITRAATFARHMPLAKLLWRARLTASRRLAERFPPSLDGPTPTLAEHPPLPVFAPRPIGAEHDGEGWHFTFVGRRVSVGDPIDWSKPGPGSRDQLWRMNLHYMEYLEGRDAATGLSLIRQWIAANPAHAKGAWRDAWNSYAVSLRLMCWMQFLARHGVCDADVHASIAQQLRFLVRNLELDLGGNHLVKNIKALLWGSAVFVGAEADGWRALGLRLLAREIEAQVLSDGVHYERSPSYHAQVLADLIECARALGDGSPLKLRATIAAMTQAAVDLAHPDGRAALFNDAGLTMAYTAGECVAAGGIAAAPQRVFGYRDAGYFGAHSTDWSLIADMGRIGPDDLPAHAHGDIGSFELSIAGERMIVDQGVFEYVAGDKRAASRAAASHAALAIAGGEQADFFGAFRCGRRPDVTIDRWEPRDDGFVLEGRHDGYASAPGGGIAVRRFEVSKTAIIVHDRIERHGGARASVGLLLHPGARAEIIDSGVVISTASATILIDTDIPVTIEPAVWWPDMGHEVATSRLRLTWPVGCSEATLHLRPMRRIDAGQS